MSCHHVRQEYDASACTYCIDDVILRNRLSDIEAQLRDIKHAAAVTEEWLIECIDGELHRIGLPSLQWTDGGGSTCPAGWHRRPYISSSSPEHLAKRVKYLEAELERERLQHAACLGIAESASDPGDNIYGYTNSPAIEAVRTLLRKYDGVVAELHSLKQDDDNEP
jgi:hypothetical protein